MKSALQEAKPMLAATIPSLDGFRAVSTFIAADSHCGLGSIVSGGMGVMSCSFLSGYLNHAAVAGGQRNRSNQHAPLLSSTSICASANRFDSLLYGTIPALVSQQLSVTNSARMTPLQMRICARFWLAGLLLSLLNRGIVFQETIRGMPLSRLMPIFFRANIVHDSKVTHLFDLLPARRIGVYSYSIYLLHFILRSPYRLGSPSQPMHLCWSQ